jgi:hypothetical protein
MVSARYAYSIAVLNDVLLRKSTPSDKFSEQSRIAA